MFDPEVIISRSIPTASEYHGNNKDTEQEQQNKNYQREYGQSIKHLLFWSSKMLI